MDAGGKTVVLFACFGVRPEPWLAVLQQAAPDFDWRVWPDSGAKDEVDYVVVWAQPDGFLRQFVNLRAVLCIGAGVDRILQDSDLPDVPIARMRDEGLTQGMVEFVLARVLHYHRLMPAYEEQQRQALWRPLTAPLASERTVGVLGLGQLGGACAVRLAVNGFAVRGWSRTPRDLPGVTAFDGPLEAFLEPCEVVVCLLPLTPATRGVLNARTLSRLSGASLINVGRGAHLVEADLIPALDAGHLAHATLDVFATEPLPGDHPFWSDRRITVVPHASALTPPHTAGPTIVANIRRHLAGSALLDQVDRAEGY